MLTPFEVGIGGVSASHVLNDALEAHSPLIVVLGFGSNSNVSSVTIGIGPPLQELEGRFGLQHPIERILEPLSKEDGEARLEVLDRIGQGRERKGRVVLGGPQPLEFVRLRRPLPVEGTSEALDLARPVVRLLVSLRSRRCLSTTQSPNLRLKDVESPSIDSSYPIDEQPQADWPHRYSPTCSRPPLAPLVAVARRMELAIRVGDESTVVAPSRLHRPRVDVVLSSRPAVFSEVPARTVSGRLKSPVPRLHK
jgi:hypothetical protein